MFHDLQEVDSPKDKKREPFKAYFRHFATHNVDRVDGGVKNGGCGKCPMQVVAVPGCASRSSASLIISPVKVCSTLWTEKMPVTFGSVGDIISVCLLVDALDKSKGASAE